MKQHRVNHKDYMRKTLFVILKAIISTVLVFFLVRFVDWSSVWMHLTQTRWEYVMAFLFFLLSGIGISAIKWRTLAHVQGFMQPLWFYLHTYLIATFVNNFLPSFVGGDAYRIFALAGGKKHDVTAASQSVIVDRLSGLGGVIVLSALFGSMFLLQNDAGMVLSLLISGMVLLAIVMLLLLYFFRAPLLQKGITFLPAKIAQYIVSLGAFRDRRVMFPAFVYSILFAFVALALSNYMLFLALGVHIAFLPFLSVIFVISIIASVPVSIGNIGVKEWAYVTLFGLLGVNASAAVTVVLLSRILQMLVSFVALPLYLTDRQRQQ